MALLKQRETDFLPLCNASKRKLNMASWVVNWGIQATTDCHFNLSRLNASGDKQGFYIAGKSALNESTTTQLSLLMQGAGYYK